MPDLVLLTGISGFLGGHVALQLLKAGYRVRGSVRNLDRSEKVRETLARHGADIANLEFVALDLLSDNGWERAAAGTRYLQHVASPFVLSMPKDKMELIRPAVEGTERAINAALKANVERIVLTSSFAAIGYGHPRNHSASFTESDWTRLEGGTPLNAYIESKTRAERRAWELMRQAGRERDLATINPTGIFGPLLDDDPGTSGSLIQRLMTGSVPAAVKMEIHGVDVRDVAELHLRAMTAKEAGGKRFLASAGDPSMIDTARHLAKHFPAYRNKLPRIELPDWIVGIYALFDSDIRGNLGELSAHKTLDASAATALLGRPLIPVNDAIVATGESLIAQKLI